MFLVSNSLNICTENYIDYTKYFNFRTTHAFLWACSFGGFGIGWLRDLFRISEYVDAANGDEVYYTELVYPIFIGTLKRVMVL